MRSKTSVRDRRRPESRTTAVDTSVVVAALLGWHEDHTAAREALERALSRGDTLVLPGHVLVEAYAVLTRLPSGNRVAPAAAHEMLSRGFEGRARVVTLSDADLWSVLDASSRANVAGGVVYDARVLAAAANAQADELLTLNVRDYERLDAGRVRIVEP